MSPFLFNQESEMCLLSATLVRPEGVETAQGLGITEETFYHPAHKILWRAILGCGSSDVTLILDWLDKRNLRNDVGGPDYIEQVLEELPIFSAIEKHAGVILDAARRRAVHSAAQNLMKLATSENNTSVVIAAATNLAETIPSGGVKAKTFWEIELGGEVRGMSTGFPGLDQLISTRGFPAGQMTVVSAYHKGGKTSFMLDTFLHSLKAERRVLYATFADLDARGIKERLIAKVCGFSRRPADLDENAVYDNAERWLNAMLDGAVYDGFAEDDDSIEAFAAFAAATHRKDPWDAIWIDYAQELRSTAKSAMYSPEQNQTECARVVVKLARQLDIPCIVGSQITEGAEGKRNKTKWSRAWEEKGGWVLGLDRDEGGPMVEVAYSRFGPQTTKNGRVAEYLDWDPKRVAFVGRTL